MSSPSTSPIPSDAPFTGTIVVDKQTGTAKTVYMSEDFANWLLEQQTRWNQSPVSVGDSINVSGSSASIATTPAFTTLDAGMYRVTFYARVVTAGTISSSLTVTIGWTDEAVSCTKASAAATGNTTGTTVIGELLIRSDQAQAITYSTTYASAGATAMQYDLVVVVEQVPV
jgi:hypothetical protein